MWEVSYDGLNWRIEAGPNHAGYYTLTRWEGYERTIRVHGSDPFFTLPEGYVGQIKDLTDRDTGRRNGLDQE